MINVHLQGRLGNILFQYAVGRHLALKNNTELNLNLDYYIKRKDPFCRRIRKILGHFSINRNLYNKTGPKHILKIFGIDWPFPRYGLYNEVGPGFYPEVLDLGNGTAIKGLFQSEKYFKEIEEVIRNDLKIDSRSFGQECRHYEGRVLTENSVSLHVRRGDYINTEFRHVCDINYFLNSVEYMKSNLKSPHFFVFSDDIEWCRKNLNIPECSFVEIKHSKSNPVIDLHLMSKCKHNIISNSSFSWWGAWLNENQNKIVIAPESWRSDFKTPWNVMKDKLPEEWVKMSL